MLAAMQNCSSNHSEGRLYVRYLYWLVQCLSQSLCLCEPYTILVACAKNLTILKNLCLRKGVKITSVPQVSVNIMFLHKWEICFPWDVNIDACAHTVYKWDKCSCLCSYLYIAEIAEMSQEDWEEQWVKRIPEPKPGRPQSAMGRVSS